MTSRRIACVGLAVAALFVAACGSASSPGTTSAPKSQAHVKPAKFAGTRAIPRKPAAPLVLRDYRGRLVNLRQFRGKAVFVTFIYTHCPDVCPLIVGHLHAALAKLGPEAKKVQIIAVSTDPRGDTPGTVTTFLREHQMLGRMEYLLGSKRALEHAWADWSIIAKPAPTGRDLVEHSALIYGISASGEVTTLYPASFVPEQIVHDAPILASE